MTGFQGKCLRDIQPHLLTSLAIERTAKFALLTAVLTTVQNALILLGTQTRCVLILLSIYHEAGL